MPHDSIDGHPSPPPPASASLQDLQAAFARMLADQHDGDRVAQDDPIADRGPIDNLSLDGSAPRGQPAQAPDRPGSDSRDNHDWDSHGPRVTQQSIVEAILFVGHPQHEPLSARAMAAVMRGVAPSEVDDLVQQLNQQYETDGNPYQIEAISDGYRMVLRPAFEALRTQFLGRVKHAKLSQATVEVLAIVAYQQPVSCETIDKVRGRPSGPLLRALVQRELVRIEKAPDKPRERLYATTQRFLDLFDLDSLDDLPLGEDLERAVR